MKKIIGLILLVNCIFVSGQNCNVLFSFGAYFEKVTFYNQSSVTNAHYYWNFGDGTSSNIKAPTHIFPGNGTYLVTLYGQDTINNCSNFYETWLNITAYPTDSCTPNITDSIWVQNGETYLLIKDLSSNCNGYNKTCITPWGQGGWYPLQNLGNIPINSPSAILFSNNVTTNLVAVKTTVTNFDRSKNYNNCSANFEYSVVSEDSNHHRIRFKAMNKNAVSYKWSISGFGDDIHGYADTISANYLVNNFNNYWLDAPVMLTIIGQNGCKDTLVQRVAQRHSSTTYVGLKELNQNEINLKLLPNPVKDKFQLQFNENEITLDKITITNTLGQLIFELSEPKPMQEINISQFPIGVYYLKAKNNGGQKVFKIVKE